MTSTLSPVKFDAPLVNPAPGGLYPVTSWSDATEDEPTRWLPSGVEVRGYNYGGEGAFGVWTKPMVCGGGGSRARERETGVGRPGFRWIR